MNRTGSELLHTMLLATSALVASTLLSSTAAMAGGPTGGKVAVGSATITTPSSTQTVVNQTSQKALINWNSFSVPTGSSITFDQPNTTSLTVNRVLGPNASAIDGQLLANGNIWLINANGILFGHGSQVNVGALLATTSDISDDDFKKGRYRFTKAGNPGASVVNQGSITAAQGGSVVLSGAQVSNQGIVQANLGTVVLGGANAFTVDLDGDNLLRYQITAPVTAPPKGTHTSGSALVSNSGTIAAVGGRILLTARAARNVHDDVINNTGQIEATTVSSHNGEIDFDAGPDGTVNAGGTIDASGTASGQTGGAINIAGGTVNVTNGATINASGDAGGGSIQIGGGLHGKGTIANSNATNIGNATISANAITRGNGGTVAIWSNGTTNFSGTVSARGGAQGGNGGLVETSGGNVKVGVAGKVITSAAKGATGDWLIDPTNIDIVTGGTDGIGGSNIDPNTIVSALGSTNVTLEATNDITVDSAVDYSSTNTLSLLASQDIIANAGIQNSGSGAINLIAGWDGETTNLSQLANSGVYGNNNGTITIGGENASGNVAIGSAGGTTTFAAANLTIESDRGYAQAGYHGAGGGDIVVDLTGNLALNGYGGESNYAQLGNGSPDGGISGDVTGNISINAADTTTINVGEGGGTAWIGNFTGEGFVESGNLTLITGSGELGNFGKNVVADLGSTNQPGSGGDVLIGFTNTDLNVDDGGGNYNSPHNLSLLSVDNINLGSTIQNSGAGNINVVAGWNGTTTDLSHLTNAGVYGNNGGSITIGGDNGFGNVAVGSAGGTTLFEGGNLNIDADTGYAQAGYHGAGGGNIVANLTGNLTLTAFSGEGGAAQFGNGSLAGDVGGNITGNISINAGGNTVINIGEGGGTAWIGNFAGEGAIESGNLTLITGEVQNSGSFGGADSIGAMLIADLGTTSAAGSGGNVTFALTNPTTDFINSDLLYGAIEYNSPNALTLLSTENITLPYSIQNDGTGDLTILAGWNPAVAPADVLTTPDAYGQNAGFLWVVGDTGNLHDYNPDSAGSTYVDSGAGVAIGSKGGTTNIGAAQIYVEGLSGYAQIGYHNDGGTGTINVVANGTPGTGGLTGVGACFDGNANICVIGGRQGSTDENNDPSYAQIGDLGLGVAGTASANINVSATGNIAVAGGGIYDNSDNNANDPQIPNAYGMIGNGDGAQTVAQTVSGTINVDVAGSLNFASSTGTGSEAWLGNRTGSGGLASGDLTAIVGTENDSGPIDFGDMIFADLGSTSQQGSGGNVTLAQTTGNATLQTDSGIFYNSPNNLTLMSVGNIDVESSVVNSGSGSITLVAGWNPSVAPSDVFTTPGAYGVDNGSVIVGGPNAVGNVAVGSMTGDTTVAGANVGVAGFNGYAQIGFPGSGGSGTINVYATSSAPPIYDEDSTPCLKGSGNVCLASGPTTGFYAQIGNGGYGMTGTSSGNINVAATGNVVLIGGGTTVTENALVAGSTIGSYAMIGNGDASQINAVTIGGDINITAGGETYLDSGSDPSSPAWIGNLTAAAGSEHGNLTLVTGTENDQGGTSFRQMIETDLGAGDGSGGDVIVGFTDPNGNVQIDNGVDYTSSNSLQILSVTDIAVNSTFQNSGSGDITLVAGWDGHTLGAVSQLESANAYGANGAEIMIGGTNASGDASIGTSGGTMTVLTDNLDVESDNGIAQLGSIGAGTGNINVVALGDVTVDALAGTYAQIGNGGAGIEGNAGGAIDVSAGGTILVESDSQQGNAAIGNIGGSSSSESGDITLNAGALVINSVGAGSNAFVGNGSVVASTGGATGNITVTAGDVGLGASGDDSQAFIGDGERFKSSGTTGGTIDINSATLEIVADESDSETSQARIANRGAGNVVGTYNIVTTGDIVLAASDANLAAIGSGEGGTGTSSGSLTVQSGGSLSLLSADSGETRIGNGAAGNSAIDVTAAGDILLAVAGNPGENGSGSVLIGNLGGDAGGNVSVTSTGGSVSLIASESGSAVQIGNIQNGATADVSGNILVSAQDNVTLAAAGANTAVQIGNGGVGTQGNDAGNVTVNATTGDLSAALNGDGSYIQLGNGGNNSSGIATGDTTLTAGTSVQLAVSGSAADSGSYIQVGDGSAFDATSGGGNIVVNAASMSTSNSVDFVGNSLDVALSGAGESIGADSELRVTVNDLALTTNNGSAFVYSTQGVSLGLGEGGIDLGTGGLDIASAGAITQTNAIAAGSLVASTSSGAIALTNASNAIAVANLSTSGSDDATLYSSGNLSMSGADVGGNLTLLTKGNLTFTDSANAGGAILAVAGWDGTTTSASALTTGTAYGNNSGSITIGGANQDENVDVGSASGSTTLAGDNVSLTANNGFVQLGYNGAGSGDIDVVASGNVSLTAGTQKDEFAQIGNGGWNASGNESGSITVDAAGNVVLDGGSGMETYAQIGHGGTASNSNSEGYSDTGLITVDGQSVTLAAGSSQGSYTQIGNGGYQSGQNSSGTLTLGGDINVNAVSAVTLTGNGQDAYAQIGNGGDFVNAGAGNGTTGTISGDIDVAVTDASTHTSPDPVSATAGTGADSYAQIGNGGNGENSPAEGASVTFNISGNVTIADLTLHGSDTGQDGYAQVGNGDASGTGTGNISGDITIGPGIDVTIDNGTAPGASTMIGNDTGFGTVTGTITGYTPPSSGVGAAANGAVATTTQTPITPTDSDINVIPVTPGSGNPDQPVGNQPPIIQPPGPLDQLADNGNSEGTDSSDALTSSLGQSLDSRSHNAPITVVRSIIPGVLTEVVMKDAHGPHGVPPADEDYSSWGNEALWRW